MRIAKIEVDGALRYATVGDAAFNLIEGDIFGDWKETGKVVPTDAARLMAPVHPPQIIAIGLNYKRHAVESGMAIPTLPLLFVKTSNTITGPDHPVVLPKTAPNEVDYEVELVVVMGQEAKNVAEADVADYILGYTIGNDVSARDCQLKIDKQWARGKCFDTFAPIGPWIETELDGDNADINLKLNGETMQDSNTSDLIFSVSELVSFISQNMTLAPGSIIMTGTPEGVGFGRKPPVFLKDGDVIEATIAGIGVLRNQVVAE